MVTRVDVSNVKNAPSHNIPHLNGATFAHVQRLTWRVRNRTTFHRFSHTNHHSACYLHEAKL